MTDFGLLEDDGATGDAIQRLAEGGDPVALEVWTKLRCAREIAAAIGGLADQLGRVSDELARLADFTTDLPGIGVDAENGLKAVAEAIGGGAGRLADAVKGVVDGTARSRRPTQQRRRPRDAKM